MSVSTETVTLTENFTSTETVMQPSVAVATDGVVSPSSATMQQRVTLATCNVSGIASSVVDSISDMACRALQDEQRTDGQSCEPDSDSSRTVSDELLLVLLIVILAISLIGIIGTFLVLACIIRGQKSSLDSTLSYSLK